MLSLQLFCAAALGSNRFTFSLSAAGGGGGLKKKTDAKNERERNGFVSKTSLFLP